ncbi:DUF6250 domain-containing protein [Cerasicoccus arenae]|uniref:DUF6250 domain-containing protein n=1 Tax=Cerasicoccus arenae TaxID=424488 RepID=A0A8J3DE93_9BACT|nr:DUF6250 domain-containing protein [Cerasicoccus arenae]MBK1860015.1 hypothetical protein [Cerasicoccus arenae]GHC13809.1 hypothetical protein GCM10007047_33900 [Cerasicoccus arenae]
MKRILPTICVSTFITLPLQLTYAHDLAPAMRHFKEQFTQDLSHWTIEQQPNGKTGIQEGQLVINDDAGATVWFHERLHSPLRIRFQVQVASSGRISDINMFWMARDPSTPENLFHDSHTRNGRFNSYRGLETYYASIGGNDNQTTRFRRYDGLGNRPLRPEHDLRIETGWIQPDTPILIELTAVHGKVQVFRDGALIFEFDDSEFLASGWFGIRTVNSHLKVDFVEIVSVAFPASGKANYPR